MKRQFYMALYIPPIFALYSARRSPVACVFFLSAAASLLYDYTIKRLPAINAMLTAQLEQTPISIIGIPGLPHSWFGSFFRAFMTCLKSASASILSSTPN